MGLVQWSVGYCSEVSFTPGGASAGYDALFNLHSFRVGGFEWVVWQRVVTDTAINAQHL